jgi:CelD/BcsL family acetyltransferase involved in cellulose biosynthesis
MATMASSYTCRIARSCEEILPHLAAWRELTSRAIEDNFYLAPDFVVPALRHLVAPGGYVVVFVYRHDAGGEQLAAVAPFSLSGPTWRCPLKVLRGLSSPHSYLSHPLVARDDGGGALEALWRWLERPEHPWHLVHFKAIAADSPFGPLAMQSLRQRQCLYRMRVSFLRPMLKRYDSFAAYLDDLPAVRRKNYKRRWRQLEHAGKVEVILHRRLDGADDLAGRFMAIERLSWKGRAGSALACTPANAAFFREMVENSAREARLFFVELRLNGRTIAMTSNFVCGRTMFAFKIAYDPDYREFSPGILVEVQTVRLFLETPGLACGEGGSSDASYLRAYWRDLREMQAMYVATSKRWAGAYLALLPIVWRIRSACGRLLQRSAHWLVATYVPNPNAPCEVLRICSELI